MNYSLVHGFSQARIQKWVAISLPRGSSWLRDPTQVSCIAGSFFTDRATKDTPLAIVSSVVKNIVVTISFFFLHILRNRIVGKKSACNSEGPNWFRKIPQIRARLPTPVFLGFPYGSAGQESTWYAGDLSLIPGLGRYPGEGKSYPLQYSGLENSIECTVHGVAKIRTQLSLSLGNSL